MGTLHCDPGSDESLALMKGWIDDCQRRHHLCMKMPHQRVCGPKRLLQCLSDGSVRLETQSPAQRCDYIALSYCWGDGTAVKKTTMETLDRHQLGIPEKSLPRIYREVAAIARGLNIAYLWIDSLCIIQDSPEDKEKEIKQMSNIYRGALIVVVAASAPSPSNSLLRVNSQSDRSRTWRTASMIRYKEMDLDVKFRKRSNEAHHSTLAIIGTPIVERGWCFQEKLLASRCLVFLDDEVVWECQSCCLCECGGKQKHFHSESTRMSPYEKHLLPLAEQEPFQLDGTLRYFADAEAAYTFWESAVQIFSLRALKYETDRLPAISAIALIVAEATGDRYLAGRWRDDLLAGLSWLAHTVRDDPRPHQKYIAPSWSWASLPRGVNYDSWRTERDVDLDASVLDAWTTWEGQNPYAPVSDAAIVLSGFHCDAELTMEGWSPEGLGYVANLDFGDADVQTVRLGWRFRALDFIRVEPDTNVDGLGRNSRYLRHVTDHRAIGQPYCSGTVHLLWLQEYLCLILTPSCRRKGAFERLGILGVGGGGLKMPKVVQRSSITLV